MKKKNILLIVALLIVACNNIHYGKYVDIPDGKIRDYFIGGGKNNVDSNGIKKIINNQYGNVCLMKEECYEIKDFNSGKVYLLKEIKNDKDIDIKVVNKSIYLKNGSNLYWLKEGGERLNKISYKFNEYSDIYRYRDGVLTLDDEKNIIYVMDGKVEVVAKVIGHMKGVLDDDTILVLDDGGEYELNLNTNEKKYFSRNNYKALEYNDGKVLMVMNPKGSEIGQALDVGIFYEGGLTFEIINVFEPFVYDRKSGKVTKYIPAVW